MRLAYICGPYRAPTVRGIVDNIRRAEAVAIDIWKARRGIVPVVPHLNSALMDGIVPDEVFLNGALALMARCDLVIVLPGSEDSRGSQAEIARAVELGIPVENWPDDWDGEDNIDLFNAFHEAIDYAPRRRKEYAEANTQ